MIQVHVPLDIAATDASMTSNAYLDRDDDEPASDLLPMHHLTATTILGGTIPDLDILGQTVATQIASAIKTRDERETRMLVLGVGPGQEHGRKRGIWSNGRTECWICYERCTRS